MSGIAHMQAVQVLASAQKTAERFLGEAQEYCRELAENARQRRDQLIAEAQLNARDRERVRPRALQGPGKVLTRSASRAGRP